MNHLHCTPRSTTGLSPLHCRRRSSQQKMWLTVLCVVALALGVAGQGEVLTLIPGAATGPFTTAVTGAPAGAFDVSATTTTLGPCVLRSLHTHKATELLYVIKGNISSYQINENGTVINETLSAGMGPGTGPQAVIYPAGRQHLQYNPTCRVAKFIAFFPVNPADIGTVNIPGADYPADKLPANILEIGKNGPVPAEFTGNMTRYAPTFTPAASGTFSFSADTAQQAVDACLIRCKFLSSSSGGKSDSKSG